MRRRMRPRAYSAICTASCSPAMRASNIARPLTPKISEATTANLMLALSSTFCRRLMQAVDLLRAALHQGLALAQRTDRRGRDEARAQQAMAQQVRQPFAVLAARFAPRHRAPVLRGYDEERAALRLEHVEHRMPVHARRLHGHVRHLERVQPVGMSEELS